MDREIRTAPRPGLCELPFGWGRESGRRANLLRALFLYDRFARHAYDRRRRDSLGPALAVGEGQIFGRLHDAGGYLGRDDRRKNDHARLWLDLPGLSVLWLRAIVLEFRELVAWA